MLRILFAVLLVQLSFAVNAQEPVNTEALLRGETVSISNHLYFLHDVDGLIELTEVIDGFKANALGGSSSVNWQPGSLYRTLLFRITPTWYYLDIKNPSSVTRPLVFQVDDPMVFDIAFYLLDESNNIVRQYRVGSHMPWDARPVNHPFYLLPFAVPPGKQYRMLLRAEGRANVVFNRGQLRDAVYVDQSGYGWTMSQWFNFGNYALFFIFSLGILYVTKDISFAWFSCFAVSVFCMFFARSGFFGMLYFPDDPVFQIHIEEYALIGMFSFAFLFTNSFLDYRRNSAKLFHVNRVMVGGMIVLGLIYPFLGPYGIVPFNVVIFLTVTLLQLVNWVQSVRLWKMGVQNARYYAISWLVYYLVLFVIGLNEIGITNFSVSTNNLSQLAIGLLILFLYASLMLHFRNLVMKENLLRIKSEAKNEFLSRVSHEMRTPLNGILGLSQVISDTKLDKEQARLIGLIRQSGNSLLAVLNDVLDFSKIESGRMALESVPFSLEKLCDELEKIYREQAVQQGLSFVFNFDDKVPNTILGDEIHCRQVINNLLSNALKFTESGEVRFGVYRSGEDLLEIKVSDTGIGLTEQNREAVFEAFTQGDVSMSRRYGGTGLGLAITREIVAAMGGDIRVHPNQPEGTVFVVTLPLTSV